LALFVLLITVTLVLIKKVLTMNAENENRYPNPTPPEVTPTQAVFPPDRIETHGDPGLTTPKPNTPSPRTDIEKGE
jgi:hypothetical protein